jgi:hypothetical protein
LAAAVRRVYEECVTIEVDGRRRRVPYDVAVLYTLRHHALLGDVRAYKLLVEAKDRALAAEAAELARAQAAEAQATSDLAIRFAQFLREEKRLSGAPAGAVAHAHEMDGAAGGDQARGNGAAGDGRLGTLRGGDDALGVAAARGEAGAGPHAGGGSSDLGRGAPEDTQSVTNAPAHPLPTPQREAPQSAPVRRRSRSGPLIECRPLTGVGWAVSGR